MSVCVFILVGGIEVFIVLEGVEEMAERQKIDRDLRCQLEQREAELALVRQKSLNLEKTLALVFQSTSTGPHHRMAQTQV